MTYDNKSKVMEHIKKNATYYGIITVVVVVTLIAVFTPSAHAQFVPCVWPNRC